MGMKWTGQFGSSTGGFGVRRFIPILFAAFVVFPVGCNWLKSSGAGVVQKDQLVPVKANQRSATDYVNYLNRQAGYMNTLRYDDVSLRVSIPGQMVPSLNDSMIVCGKSNDFRMTAGTIVGNELDVGSNANEMWMYVKRSDPQYLFCSHTDFPKVQDSLPVKFEPAWVLQSLGMSSYAANREYTLDTDVPRRACFLKYFDTTAAGERVLKVTEFAYDTLGGSNPQVRQHLILSADAKKVIAIAHIKKVTEMKTGTAGTPGGVVQIPTELVLEWPQQNVKMELRLGRIKVNEPMTAELYDNLFRRPNSINSAQPVNLADYNTPRRGGMTRGGSSDGATVRK
jgi:hypothetical protein